MGFFVYSFGITDNVPSHGGGREAEHFGERWRMEQDRLGGLLDEMVAKQTFYKDINRLRKELKDEKFELDQTPTTDPSVLAALQEAERTPQSGGYSVYGIRAWGQGSLGMGHIVLKE